ncbi:Pirin-related protein [Corynebacterium epidermidicanis]|uniref:Pirin-related protein n=2 Tax=Corynebacterium epidermidicanis TaxID=1050174 RepID=A0A0G3GTC0_9CORY|nr:Pirin-related protein [Corynebacterium epidermidicanis]
MTVRRTLPQRQRSLIGAWCFIDHFGPDRQRMDVASHPHTGLQTVTWLFDGTIKHHDSGGFHATVYPGEVNLMTAGNGICHTEVSISETLHGVQLWTVLPDSDRFSAPRKLDHHRPEPRAITGAVVREFIGGPSPIETFSGLVGTEILLEPGADIEYQLNPEFEHGYLLDSGDLTVGDTSIPLHALGYTGIGEASVRLRSEEGARVVLIGGEPLGEEIVMFWNFIGRSYEEIEAFRAAWEAESEQFGEVEGYEGNGPRRLPAPALPNAQIKPRKNPPPVAQP